MIKNNILLVFIFLIFTGISRSQNINPGILELVYDKKPYEKLINSYEKIPDKDYRIKKQLADNYYITKKYTEAEKYYSQTVKSNKSVSEDIYKYASVLKINQKYDQAVKWLDKFSNLEKGDMRANLYSENKNIFYELSEDKKTFKIKNIKINTGEDDFGISYYGKKQVVFSSSKNNTKLINKILPFKKSKYINLFIADIKRSELENVRTFENIFNKKKEIITINFNKNNDFAAFTVKDISNDRTNLRIYTACKKNDKWQNPVPASFSSSEYSCAYPYITENGNKMYFASDMPGGYGGADIYFSVKDKNGKWSKPENLGKTINTEGNETVPFIDNNGILFFSSDGLPGLGGFDIFMTKKDKNNNYIKPENLGVPVNSSHNDVFFVINNEKKKGFFSSDRKDGNGGYDIYSYKLLKELKFDVIIKGKVKDTYGNILANSDIILFDAEGNPLKIQSTDKLGYFEFTVSPDMIYTVEASKPKYISTRKNIDTRNTSEINVNLTLEKMPDFIISGNIIDKETKLPLKDVKIKIKNLKTQNIKELISLENGDFYIKETDKHLYDTINYEIVFEKKGYATKTITYDEILSRYGEYRLRIQMNKFETGKDLGKLLEINPIYFDFNKYDIRPDAAKELDKIVKIMNEYPGMEIELSSHTDCRGASIYNLKLSDKRAKASADYIKKRISDPVRIYGKGYGETRLVNDCGCEGGRGKGLNCTEEQHQQNRRTEFKIIRK